VGWGWASGSRELLELVSTDRADSGEVLESVEDALDDGGFSWDTGFEGQSGDVLGVLGETAEDVG